MKQESENADLREVQKHPPRLIPTEIEEALRAAGLEVRTKTPPSQASTFPMMEDGR